MIGLRQLRLENKLTQNQLSHEFGVALLTYWRWEAGKSNPSMEQTKRIAKFFDTTVDVLLFGVDGEEI